MGEAVGVPDDVAVFVFDGVGLCDAAVAVAVDVAVPEFVDVIDAVTDVVLDNDSDMDGLNEVDGEDERVTDAVSDTVGEREDVGDALLDGESEPVTVDVRDLELVTDELAVGVLLRDWVLNNEHVTLAVAVADRVAV